MIARCAQKLYIRFVVCCSSSQVKFLCHDSITVDDLRHWSQLQSPRMTSCFSLSSLCLMCLCGWCAEGLEWPTIVCLPVPSSTPHKLPSWERTAAGCNRSSSRYLTVMLLGNDSLSSVIVVIRDDIFVLHSILPSDQHL